VRARFLPQSVAFPHAPPLLVSPLRSTLREMEHCLDLAKRSGSPESTLGPFLNTMAIAQQRAGNAAEAGNYWDTAIRAVPDSGTYWTNAANHWQESGELEKALSYHAQAVALEPGNAAVMSNHGWALEESGRLVEARDAYARAVELMPGHQQIQLNLENIQKKLQGGVV
jgi:tetratricopeptide (TPR) repeat protein